MKHFAVVCFIVVSGISLGLYAQESESIEPPEDLPWLAFKFDIGKFLQTEPAKAAEEKTAEKELEKRSQFTFHPEICALLRYEYYEDDPDTFKVAASYFMLNAVYKNVAFSGLVDPALDLPFVWGYLDWAPLEEGPLDPLSPKAKMCLRFGQFTVPFGLEQQKFPYYLDTIRYSQIVGETALETDKNFVYDKGVMLHGALALSSGASLDYQFALLNGEYRESVGDSDSSKAFSGRIAVTLREGITVGGSFYDGSILFSNAYQYAVQRRRVGGDLKTVIDRWIFQGEYIIAQDNPEGHWEGATWVPRQECEREGAYAQLGYTLLLNKRLSEKEPKGLQIIARWDILDLPRNVDMLAKTGHDHRNKYVYGFGFNWDFSAHGRLQVFYEHLDFGKYYSGRYDPIPVKPGTNDDRITVQLGLFAF